MSVVVELCGEQVELRADRSLYWPRRRTLIVADLHFGKADTFRAASIPVPGGSDSTLARLGSALDETHAVRLIVLGDFWHARPGRNSAVVEALTAWRTARPNLQMVLVKGNHDRAGPPPPSWADVWHGDEIVDEPFVYAHHPNASERGYVLAGHLHPGYRLFGGGRQTLVLPCFWLGQDCAVLPAFGQFTGTAAVAPIASDRVWVVAESEVIPVTNWRCDE